MNICGLCTFERRNKDMLECNYCGNYFCYPNCCDKHLGNCKEDKENK